MSYAHTLSITSSSCDTDTVFQLFARKLKIITCFYFYPLYILKGLLHQMLLGVNL